MKYVCMIWSSELVESDAINLIQDLHGFVSFPWTVLLNAKTLFISMVPGAVILAIYLLWDYVGVNVMMYINTIYSFLYLLLYYDEI